MVHEIDGVEHLTKGDSAELQFEVKEDGSGKDISNVDIEYKLVRGDTTVATKTNNSGIDHTVTDASAGEFYVKIDSGVTNGFPDHVDEVVRLIDTANNDQVTFIGYVEFEDPPD